MEITELHTERCTPMGEGDEWVGSPLGSHVLLTAGHDGHVYYATVAPDLSRACKRLKAALNRAAIEGTPVVVSSEVRRVLDVA